MSKFYVGSKWCSDKFGNVVLIEKVSSTHSKVLFLNKNVEKIFRNDSITSGKMSHEPYYVGSIWNTNNHGKVRVLDIIRGDKNTKAKVKVIFENTGTIKTVATYDLKKGKIKDEYGTASYWGKGCLGKATGRLPDGKNKRSYNVWHSMLKRCYDWENNCKAYKDVYVCEEWLCYEYFEKWFDKNYVEDFELDKDFTKIGNKVYCPEFCSFIPNRLNAILSPDPDKVSGLPTGVFTSHCKSKPFRARCYNVEENKNVCLGYHSSIEDASFAYRSYKIRVIKRLAEDYFKKGLISAIVYENLISLELK